VRHEVFISYSHKDTRHLAELRQFLVPFERECGITIWDDNKIQAGTAWETEITEALRRAKVAVLLVTANFIASEFVSRSELPPILQAAENEGLKILWVAASASAYKVTDIAKYQAANDPSKPLDMMTGSRRRGAWVEIAQKIYDAFTENESQRQQEVISKPGIETTEPRKCILLAQVTDDVEDEAEQLRTYLNQYEDVFKVLPVTAYPQGGDAFTAAFEHDLAQAELFVQILGRRPGRVPPDLPEGYTRFQYNRARAATIPAMLWRHPELDPSAVSDDEYKKILTSDVVVASGLEEFKRQILSWARKPKDKVCMPRSSTVFINADDRDMDIAKEIERECLRNELTAILPMVGPSSEAIRKDLAESLIDCDVLVFIYGNTTQEWIRSQLRFFSKVRPNRQSSPRLMAICSGPPPKPDIGISFPDARLIACPEGWNLEPIRKLISELAA
jgi:hypothetical protein